jgi:uncharacterized protein (DUF2141 family)
MKVRVEIIVFLLSLLGALSLPKLAQASPTSNLVVEIAGLKSRTGRVCLSIFASSQGFPDQGKHAIKSTCVEITEVPLRIRFEDLQPGSYAVAAFHDKNSTGQLERNFLGIPTEEFGFSGNPAIWTGPPKFNESAVSVAEGTTNVQIRLRSLL